MHSALRSAVVFAFASALTIFAMPGCSQQGEGERCERAKNADADCDSGLICITKSELLDPVTDRCCRADGSGSDSRCTRGSSTGTGTGGSGNAGTNSGGTSAGDTTSETGGTTSETGGTTSETGGTTSEPEAGGAGAASQVGGAGAGG